MTILVTGAAGFIGSHVAHVLLDRGDEVVGLDNLNDYYSVQLKRDRLARLQARPGFSFHQIELADFDALTALMRQIGPVRGIVHLAAQAGVRYSLTNPHAYLQANLAGHLNMLEIARHADGLDNMVYASSSSVYGGNTKLPFAVTDSVDHPVSLYAATKKSNELMAHTYSHLYGLPATGLRFFTVYGPWGRPDMAYFKFTGAIYEGRPIQIYNNGDMERDFTYIDDIVEGVARLLPRPAAPDPGFDPAAPTPATSWAPHRVYNIGNKRKERLMDMIAHLETLTGREAVKEFLPMQPGDVRATWADVDALETAVGFRPETPLRDGLARFVDWYRSYYDCR